MQIGYFGLGKMGFNMVLRLLDKGYDVVACNRSPEPIKEAAKAGANTAFTCADLAKHLSTPRTVWIMVPAGKPVDDVIFGEGNLASLLEKGDAIIDGGNSFYKESIARYKKLKGKGINFLDVGVSGGPTGARSGASIMVGGDLEIFKKYEPLFKDLAVPSGHRYMGPVGAGHFVKMVHNGIEYGMMQAIGEGFEVLKAAPFKLDLRAIAEIYSHGTVIESRLINWLKSAYKTYGEDLEGISGSISQSGEGKWTAKTAKELGIPAPIIEGSVKFREASQSKPSYTGKVVSALRNQFGGHVVTKK
ncbi:MAG: decarboxylating 6-phosphogluconate dehydrogenase [Candidatus Woykebacteria bacterium]